MNFHYWNFVSIRKEWSFSSPTSPPQSPIGSVPFGPCNTLSSRCLIYIVLLMSIRGLSLGIIYKIIFLCLFFNGAVAPMKVTINIFLTFKILFVQILNYFALAIQVTQNYLFSVDLCGRKQLGHLCWWQWSCWMWTSGTFQSMFRYTNHLMSLGYDQ